MQFKFINIALACAFLASAPAAFALPGETTDAAKAKVGGEDVTALRDQLLFKGHAPEAGVDRAAVTATAHSETEGAQRLTGQEIRTSKSTAAIITGRSAESEIMSRIQASGIDDKNSPKVEGGDLTKFKGIYKGINPPAEDPFKYTNTLFFETDGPWRNKESMNNGQTNDKLIIYVTKFDDAHYDYGTYAFVKGDFHVNGTYSSNLEHYTGDLPQAKVRSSWLSNDIILSFMRGDGYSGLKTRVVIDPTTMKGTYYFTSAYGHVNLTLAHMKKMPMKLVR